MKNLIFILLISFSTVYAQEERHEKIKALKTAYITERLELSSSEAESFWPVYNEYDRRFHELRDQKRSEVYKKINERWDDLTDAEANALIDKYLLIETKELELRKEKTIAFRKVISPKKIISLKKAEDDFNRELLDKYRKRKSEKER